jgi:hypothetical protein
MDYGKVSKTESYFNGRIKSTKTEYSIPSLVQDKAQALSEVMKALDLITTKQTHMLTIKIEADPKTHFFKLITKQYVVDE